MIAGPTEGTESVIFVRKIILAIVYIQFISNNFRLVLVRVLTSFTAA